MSRGWKVFQINRDDQNHNVRDDVHVELAHEVKAQLSCALPSDQVLGVAKLGHDLTDTFLKHVKPELLYTSIIYKGEDIRSTDLTPRELNDGKDSLAPYSNIWYP